MKRLGQRLGELAGRWRLALSPGKGHAAGLRALVQNLSDAQRDQHRRFDYFDVVGGETGAKYRIHYGDHMNIELFDASDRRKCVLCLTKDRLPVGQVMLAQKIALELFETETLRIANSLGVPPSLRWRPPPPSKRGAPPFRSGR